jgi:hypothetical protein
MRTAATAIMAAAMMISAARGEVAMVRLAGTPQQVGRTWGEINRRAIVHDMDVLYRDKAAAEWISEDALIERAKPFARIAEEIAPHWLEEARSIAQASGVRPDLYVSFLANAPRNLFLHECTSYAIARSHARGGAILFHKNRDNAKREQSAFILQSSCPGIHKFLAVGDASHIACSMMVNDQGLAGSSDYPGGLRPPEAEPQYRGIMNSSLLRHVAERASSCRDALQIIEDFVKKGYYAGGKVNGTHWLFVDRQGVILEISNNARHVVSRIHTEKAYFSKRENSRAAARLREADGPIDFQLFHGVSRDPSICLESRTSGTISGMTVEIDPDRPELLTCAWVSLPARGVSFPLLMGQTRTPACLLGGEAYLLGAAIQGQSRLWESVEQTAHASKELLKAKMLAGASAGGAQPAADLADQWAQQQAEMLMEMLQALQP